jgi:hypothetical protein
MNINNHIVAIGLKISRATSQHSKGSLRGIPSRAL